MTHSTGPGRRDAGQALPFYIVAVAGLLFLAFAFFAVGQAAAKRNDAQSAADAAALAAGQKYRDQLGEGLLDALLSGTDPGDLLDGRGIGSGEACAQAERFAQRNRAGATCEPSSWPTSFAVKVTTDDTVGHSVVDVTESTHAEAAATSVVEPRCSLRPGPTPSPSPSSSATPPATGGDDGDDGQGDGPAPVRLLCEGKEWTVDPAHPQDLPEASDLFSVRLTE
ncbi:pilus assembly protein TadG-related protein [Streptomyces sp. NPDC003077]|uniref:pilus assembly protein TadG-related protein n=1 Tax=Streptomyces sp. NPDC003077 TaxID=3154443 RepID=UPI0033A2C5D9